MDATGVYGVNKYGNLRMAKGAKAAPFALGDSEITAVINSADKVLVGHNRAATIGNAKDDNNAHPFIEDHICLVHNGTLITHQELANKTVDSNAICHSIAARGYKKTLPMINGAFALIWYDAKTKELFISRNDQRPLALLETDSSIFIASELDMLRWVCERNGQTKYSDGSFDTNIVYRFNMDKYAVIEEQFPKKVNPTPKTGGTGVGYSKQTPEMPWAWDCEYKTGDMLTFDVDTIEWDTTYNSPIVNGYTEEGSLITALLTQDMYKDMLNNPREMQVQAKISMIHFYAAKKEYKFRCSYATEVWVELPKEQDKTVVSQNGVKVTEDQFNAQCGCCDHCHGFIDFDEIKNAHIKIKKKEISTLICEDCLHEFRKSIPDYGKGKKYNKKSSNYSVPTGQQIGKELEKLYPSICGYSGSDC